MENFIRVYDDLFTPDECQYIIDWFETVQNYGGYVVNRKQLSKHNRTEKDDHTFQFDTSESLAMNETVDILQKIMPKFITAYERYTELFPVVNQCAIALRRVWMHKTTPGGGYHMWHYENQGRISVNRAITFLVYLVDIEKGGETEFLYLRQRFKPKQCRIIVFPAGYTHTHRGNPVLSDENKYTLTGWFEYNDT